MAEVDLRHRPTHRLAFATGYVERQLKRGCRLVEQLGVPAQLGEDRISLAEVVLHAAPVARRALPTPFLKGGAVGRDAILDPPDVALDPTEAYERVAKLQLGDCPVIRR